MSFGLKSVPELFTSNQCDNRVKGKEKTAIVSHMAGEW